MSSRARFVAVGLCFVSLGACTGGVAGPEDEPPARPNILIILTDDQRVGTLDVLPKTHEIFVQGGTLFPNAFATTPQCCPSRASILSGQYAHNHGVDDNAAAEDFDHDHTIQRYLSDAGYRTAISGKYINYPGSYYDRVNAGHSPPHFDRWSTFLGGYEDPMVNIDGEVRELSTYSTTLVRRRGIGYLREFERTDDDPWLLYLAPFAPHPPSVPEERYRATQVPLPPGDVIAEPDRSDKPGYVQETNVGPAGQHIVRRRQLRTLKSVDDLVAAVFRTLREFGEERETLAFFLSDNGFLWGDHGLPGKGTPYTHSVKIPLLVRWPGEFEEGGRDGRLAANLDVPATILDALDLAPEDALEMDGRSLLSEDVRERILLEHSGALSGRTIPPWASIRTARFQYVEYYDGDRVVFREYYDLVEDHDQQENLLGDDDPTNDPNVAALSRLLVNDRTCRGAGCP